MQKYLKTVAPVIALGVLSLTTQSSFAAIDVTAATTGIGEAATALASVIGALLALSVGLFGVAKVYAFIKRKAGA